MPLFDTETQMQGFREAMSPGAMGGIYTGFHPGGTAEVDPAYSSSPVETGVGTATRFNLSGDTGISDITNLINSLDRRAQSQALSARIPGAPGLEEQSSANIGSELRGQLPADVIRQLQQQAAEGGVGRGTSGAPANEAAYLRALGLTSLDLTGRGQQELSAAYARNPAAPIFDPASLLITPYQGAELGLQTGQLGLQQQEAQNRAMLEAAQLARSGGGGGGGGGTRYLPAPAAQDTGGGPMVGLSPYATMGPTLSDIMGAVSDPYTNWGSWYSSLPAGTGDTGSYYSSTPFPDQTAPPDSQVYTDYQQSPTG